MALSTAARNVSRGAKAFSLFSELASVVAGGGQQSGEGASPCDAAAPPPAKSKLVVLTLCHVLWAASLLLAQNGVRWPYCSCATTGPGGPEGAMQAGTGTGDSDVSWRTAERLLLTTVPFLKLAHPMVWLQLSSSAAALVLLLVFGARRPKRKHPQHQPQLQPEQLDQQQQQQQQQDKQRQPGPPGPATSPSPQAAGPVYAAVWPLVVAQLLPVATTLAAYGDFSQQLQNQHAAPGAHTVCASSGQHVLLLATPFLLLVLLASQAWCLQLPVKVQLLTSCLQSLGLAAVTSLFIQRWGVQVLKSWLVSSTGAWLLPLLHTSQVLPWLLRWWQQRRQACGRHAHSAPQQQQQQPCKLDLGADTAGKDNPCTADGALIGVGNQGEDMLALLQPLASSSSSSSSKGITVGGGDSASKLHPGAPAQQQEQGHVQHQQQGSDSQAAHTTAAPRVAAAGGAAAPALPHVAATDATAGVAGSTHGVQLYMPPQNRPLAWLSSQPSLQPPHTITVAAPDADTAVQGILAAVRAVTRTSHLVTSGGVPSAGPGPAAAAAGQGLAPRSSSLYSSLYKSSVTHLLLCIRVGASQGALGVPPAAQVGAPEARGAAGGKQDSQAQARGPQAAAGTAQQSAGSAAAPAQPRQRDGRLPPSPQLPVSSQQTGSAPPALSPQQEQLVAQLRDALEGAEGLPRLLSLHELQVPGWGDLMLTAAFAPAHA